MQLSKEKNGQEYENKSIDWKQWLFHWKQLLSEFISIAENFIWRVAEFSSDESGNRLIHPPFP